MGRNALIEMAFVYGIVLVFAFWELRKTTRAVRNDKDEPKP